MPNLANLPAADLQAGTAAWSGQGYIDGLKMQWVSATAITVTSGAAFVPSLNKCLQAPNAIALTGLALAASTFYHLYLYSNAGTPAIECVTTAPAAPYSGTARAKTGDASRRYVGSLLTDASANICNFEQNGLQIDYLIDLAQTPTFTRILSGGLATVYTTVSAAGAVPISSTLAKVRLTNADTTSPARFSNSRTGLVSPAGLVGLPPAASSAATVTSITKFPLDSSQQMQYSMTVTPAGGGVIIDVYGYYYER